jgi:DNA-binding response OmpR family regulator
MLCEALTHFGHSVIVARNGEDGLRLFAQFAVDLVITDLVMPEKEGFEVLSTLRKLQSPVKVIAMSGGLRGSPVDFLRMAKFLGAARVLSKPFSNEALINIINELLPSGEDMLSHPPAG